MGLGLELEPQFVYDVRPVSALGIRLREMRKQIEAAAERHETTLLSKEELDAELEALRKRDPDVS